MPDIESLLKEKRVFKAVPAKSSGEERQLEQEADRGVPRKLGAKNPERFWAKMARENIDWFKPWKKTLEWKPPFAKWFKSAAS